MIVLRPGEHTALAQTEARSSIDLPLIEDGFLSLLEGKDPSKWVIRREALHGDPQILTEVKSSCAPVLITVSDQVTLAVGCPPKGGSDHMVSAISLTGSCCGRTGGSSAMSGRPSVTQKTGAASRSGLSKSIATSASWTPLAKTM